MRAPPCMRAATAVHDGVRFSLWMRRRRVDSVLVWISMPVWARRTTRSGARPCARKSQPGAEYLWPDQTPTEPFDSAAPRASASMRTACEIRHCESRAGHGLASLRREGGGSVYLIESPQCTGGARGVNRAECGERRVMDQNDKGEESCFFLDPQTKALHKKTPVS